MSEQELVEWLSVHADGLKEEVDLTTGLLAAESAEAQALEPLLLLARQVKAALPPIEPKPDFVSTLRARLKANARQAQALLVQQKEANKRNMIWIAAGLGGLLYFIGLAVVSVRLSLALLSFVVGVLGWRMARPSPWKTRTHVSH